MTASRLKPTLLAATVGVLLASIAYAQTPNATTVDKDRELAAARADLDRAIKRVAELSRDRGDTQSMWIEQRTERRPVLGVVLAPEPATGVRIVGVTPDSAAAKAGLRSGDVVTAIAGKPIAGADDTARLAAARARLAQLDAKTPVAMTYRRDNRSATVNVTPQPGERVFFMRTDDNQIVARGRPMLQTDSDGRISVSADSAEIEVITPQVRGEIIRLGPTGDCKDGNCRLPMLANAFRWSGLNLATVDKNLGRYFGTDTGVLVLSTGEELGGLQAGDVIQRIDGKAVSSPREAMGALRDKPADSKVKVDYLRDRKSATAQLTVPKAAMLNFPLVPPAPPAPPTAPKPPKPPVAPAAPASLPAPPAPPAPPEAPKPPKLAILV